MLDIGWTELLVIAVVLIVVVGPKDLPPMLRAFGKMTQRARKMAGEFRTQFDEALRESELDDVRQTIGDAQKLNPVNSLREAMNPLRQMGNEIKADLQKATVASENKTEVPPAAVSAPTPSMSLPETPPLVPVTTPASEPVAAAALQADTVAEKPKAVRKPRAKAVDKTDAASAIAAPVERPKRTVVARKPATPRKPAQTKKKDEA
ncbi:twin-arginine translocase subunit TatB [Rhizobium bangladeshense]|uniref:Sec-independent protein translocase protein TatB n=1 Tax=Rhizobium bangladeshense TaxID=1138189 RepID=A0ABS7LHD7_9HYPH|nr:MULTISPECIES: Sec-independent protein translocase protein TatB [Rhizobium]MBX4870687.1 twin-arginine translocase subunit TatB [Rhizobium bangladeshense]MBX4872598.1 twin-arginine translocase subunit TatB [Rhizobium bangladeshense]MBX4883915.1 twin-arginine translocase subunit TatB [Rhizobium bangladeshense]MBX4889889.1 twin-arginine translocase subunit TatB [Rhizobium bangladeshense]MBX4895502.1 twin-arginine translocase subunit TatB [Rhizobium bangladeshense]